MADDGGFFSRWSRRKAAERADPTTGASVARPLPVVPADVEPNPFVPVPVARPAAVGDAPTGPAQAAEEGQGQSAEAPPPLDLDDVRRLTPDADFRPFVARDVAPEVRNAAFKKLFADPTFNVMDGLDIYVDDYSQPDPLPASLARQLVSARSLGLFDDTSVPKVEPPAVAAGPVGASDDSSQGAEPVDMTENQAPVPSAEQAADTPPSTDTDTPAPPPTDSPTQP